MERRKRILQDHAEYIIGRVGIPYNTKVISLIRLKVIYSKK